MGRRRRPKGESYKSQHGVDDPHWMQYPGPIQTNKQDGSTIHVICLRPLAFCAEFETIFYGTPCSEMKWAHVNISDNSEMLIIFVHPSLM